MKNFGALLLGLLIGVSANADLLTVFKKLDTQRKGPFSQNFLQGPTDRVVVNNGDPLEGVLFQAAFRNDVAKELATTYDFYVANLFTTNFYELNNEYVFNDIYGSHPIDQQGLFAQSVRALPKAASMVRHWVIEKYYVQHFQNTAVSRAFRIRGISDAQNELDYATLFFNFYFSSAINDFQYLPAFLLLKDSPLWQSASIDKARELVATTYDDFAQRLGVDDPRVKRLWEIRNMVHNQLSPTVIGAIDRYVSDFPEYRAEGNTSLFKVQDILREYYSFNAGKIGKLAVKIQRTDIKLLTDTLLRRPSDLSTLLQLSQSVADLKSGINNAVTIPFERKTDTMLLISSTCQLLNKEIGSLKAVDSIQVFQIILNTIYMEGFLIKDNWLYFGKDLAATLNVKVAASLFPDIIEIATDTLNGAFTPALGQWISIEPGLQKFSDDVIKSSALNTAALSIQKIRGR